MSEINHKYEIKYNTIKNVKFIVGYMDKNEEQAMHDSNTIGCWYCGTVGCCLTHKGDDYKKAIFPDRNPYK